MDNHLILPLEHEEEVADPFGQFVHTPQLLVEETVVHVDGDRDRLEIHGRDGGAESVWWKKPSPWWFVPPLLSIN
jgi:hypothetical protein